MLLEAKNLHKVYNSGKKPLEVLKGVNLNISRGEFVAVVGPSGAGKSTLLHMLGGLDVPTKGTVAWEGVDIYSLRDSLLCKIRNKSVGFVFQFYHLMPEFTVLENVLMPARISHSIGISSLQMREKALDLLSKVGLKARLKHFPHQLSGGEKQRVAIVRGLMNVPQLLLCDEPTGNLDSKTGDDIISLIKAAHKENTMAIALVTHNLELARVADRVYHLKDGILVN